MDAPTLRTLTKLEAVAAALAALPTVGAEAYANGGHRAQPIVARHFTRGNQQRYGWAPLSPAYKARKPPGLPMLVLTGELKAFILSRSHPVTQAGDTARIAFIVPDYAHYLQEGTDKMPRRSPVDPNEADAQEVRAEMQKFLDAALGTAKRIPVTRAIPPAARSA